MFSGAQKSTWCALEDAPAASIASSVALGEVFRKLIATCANPSRAKAGAIPAASPAAAPVTSARRLSLTVNGLHLDTHGSLVGAPFEGAHPRVVDHRNEQKRENERAQQSADDHRPDRLAPLTAFCIPKRQR